MTIATPPVEIATVADLPAIHTLRLAQGWSATDEVVRAVMAWERGRVFVIRASALAPTGEPAETQDQQANEAADAPVVVTGAIAAGEIGVIGSVIVRDDYQRRGLGRYIMGYALDWLRAMGAQVVYLDATPAGRPLYTALGFESLGVRSWFTLTPLTKIDHAVLAHRAGPFRATSVDTTGASALTSALTRLAALDGAAFGGDRLGLIAALLRRPNYHLYVADDLSGAPAGYLVAAPSSEWYHGVRVGPWVATSERAAAATLLCALQSADEWLPPPMAPSAVDAATLGALRDERRKRRYDEPQMVLSLPGTTPQARELLRAIGCELVLDDLMMRLDLSAPLANRAIGDGATPSPPATARTDASLGVDPRLAGDPTLVYAWMASMVF